MQLFIGVITFVIDRYASYPVSFYDVRVFTMFDAMSMMLLIQFSLFIYVIRSVYPNTAIKLSTQITKGNMNYDYSFIVMVL